METMQYAEELVREYLVFRGFTNTLQSFDKELSTDIGRSFHVDKIFDLIFAIYIPKFQAENLVNLLTFFKQCFSSSDTSLVFALSKLNDSILRYYVVHCIQAGKKDKVVEFFDAYGNNLLVKDQDWVSWFAIPYLKNPELDPKFRLYFSKEWLNGVHIFVKNFLSDMLNGTPLLKISSERNNVNNLKKDIKQLNLKLSELQALLEQKEVKLSQLRSNASLAMEVGFAKTSSSSHSDATVEHSISSHKPTLDQKESFLNTDETRHIDDLQSHVNDQAGVSGRSRKSQTYFSGDIDNEKMQREEDFPEVKVQSQETFLGHTSPISRCRFSPTGDNIASASIDGTVRIWTYNSSAQASRNATIYSGAEIMSLEWDCKSDRLLLIGTGDGGIKAWNADAKRVVCDLYSPKAFPSILDIKCSPVEPVFVSAAASRGEEMDFASLTVWNMRTWKAMTVLPLGEDPPAIASLCFNHNGKLLAAGAIDGMIHIFDMSAGLQITGWPAHDSAICSLLFGSDETSIFSLGIDGKIFEWSLHNQGEIVWSQNCSKYCDSQKSSRLRHEMALDASGRNLLVTSSSVRAPIYQVQDNMRGGMRSLPHSKSVTTVDWHPTLPIFLTGSADHSVRVTSIL